MRNEVSGRVSGANHRLVQVRDVYGNVTLSDSSRSEGRPGAKPPARKPKSNAGVVVLGVAVIMIGIIAEACGTDSRDTEFPAAELGTRPAAVSDDLVAQVVTDKLRLCATEVVLAPANCPQSHPVSSGRNVRWDLVGDPRDGMQVRWHNDRFFARGTAVMTVSYHSDYGQTHAVKWFHFQTEVPWRGEETRIDTIYQPKTAPPAGTIRKDRFNLPDNDLTAAVRNGFTACASSVIAPMPPTCPRTFYTPSAKNVVWAIEGNPVGNWTSSRDAEFGLLRLTASYSLVMNQQGSTFFQPQSQHTQAGTYEATIVRTANKTARLLEIRHKA